MPINQRTYDVSPDGLMIKEATIDGNALSPSMTVVLHWTEELKAKMPVK